MKRLAIANAGSSGTLARLTFLGMLIAGLGIIVVGWHLWRDYKKPAIPPEVLASAFTAQLPIVGPEGKPILVTLEAKGWTIPPDMQEDMWRYMVDQHPEEVKAMIVAMVATATQRAAATGSAPATTPATTRKGP